MRLSLKYCSLTIKKSRGCFEVGRNAASLILASSTHTFLCHTADGGGRLVVTRARSWGLECVSLCVCLCVCVRAFPTPIDVGCYLTGWWCLRADLGCLAACSSLTPPYKNSFFTRSYFLIQLLFSQRHVVLGSLWFAVFIPYSSSESSLTLKHFSSSLLLFSLIHFCSLVNSCWGLCSKPHLFPWVFS